MKGIRGFTLIEVLVALIVVALALLALSRTAALEVNRFDALRTRTLAGWVAANVLTEMRIAEPLPAAGKRDGHMRYSGREWRWQLTVQSTPDTAIQRLDVDIFAGEDKLPMATLTGFSTPSVQP